jgi:MFS transporter, OFA family, oxalate/formate antiporter
LLAWGMAAIPSPIMIARVRQNTGSYGPAITVIAVVMLVSLILPLIARRPSREQRAVSAVTAGTD